MSASPVTKIAIVNPYLQRGITESSEVEATLRFIQAAKNMGIEAVAFTRSDDVYDFNPDFVIPISPQEPKLTHFPTYGLLINPLKWTLASMRFVRNIFSYDGYCVVTPNVYNWVQNLCERTNKSFHAANAAFSLGQTTFKPHDFKKALAVYMGVNWDGSRHIALFEHLAEGDYIKCFGPKESWAKYPAKLYGGLIPFDGVTALATYSAHGIGLGINHHDMDNEGIPTCRTFEIHASSAAAICARNVYIEKHYGDSVMYVDMKLNSRELAESIKEKIEWIRSQPQQAQEMAKSAHEIFNRQLSLEFFIGNMIKMHQEVLQEKGYLNTPEEQSPVTKHKPKVSLVVLVEDPFSIGKLIQDIQNQTYREINLILLAANGREEITEILGDKFDHSIEIIEYTGTNSNSKLMQTILKNGSEWIGVLKNDDKLFVNHVATLIKHYKNSTHYKNNESSVVVFSSSLEHSSIANLKDKIQDPHMLYLNSKTRVGNITPCAQVPLNSVLIKLTAAMIDVFKNTDFRNPISVGFSTSDTPVDVAIHANEITCSSATYQQKKISTLVITNATSPLNFSNYQSFGQGALLVDERQRQKLLQSTQ